MIELNNEYALDGRNTNSCTGIFRVPAPAKGLSLLQRPVFGKVRYMGYSSTMKRIKLVEYMMGLFALVFFKRFLVRAEY